MRTAYKSKSIKVDGRTVFLVACDRDGRMAWRLFATSARQPFGGGYFEDSPFDSALWVQKYVCPSLSEEQIDSLAQSIADKRRIGKVAYGW